jgi:Ferritin-like domain
MIAPHPITRRRMIVDAIAAGTAGTGVVSLARLADADPSRAAEAPETDGQLIYKALAVELLLIAVYERVLAGGKLSLDHQSLVTRVLAYEHVHARVLGRELRALGVAAPPSLAGTPTQSLDAILRAKQVSQGIAGLGSDADAIRLLMRVEDLAEGAYFAAIPKLGDPRLVLRCTELLASEGQHRTLLSLALDPGAIDKAVSVAFVQGRAG